MVEGRQQPKEEKKTSVSKYSISNACNDLPLGTPFQQQDKPPTLTLPIPNIPTSTPLLVEPQRTTLPTYPTRLVV